MGTFPRLSSAANQQSMSWAEKNPFLHGSIVTSLKHSFADAFAQVVIEKKSFSEINWTRNVLFLAFGGYVSFNNAVPALLVPRFLPYLKTWNKMPFKQKMRDGKGLRQAAVNFCCEKLGTTPFSYFPAYYVLSEVMTSEDRNPASWVRDGIGKYIPNMRDDLITCWKVWMPVGLLTYSVIPIHLRMSWMAGMGFLWTIYLSTWKNARKGQLNQTARALEIASNPDMLADLVQGSSKLLSAFKEHAKDGVLNSIAELGKVLKIIGVNEPTVVENLFHLMDSNHDGKIDFHELAVVLFLLTNSSEAAGGSTSPLACFMFAFSDNNCDGLLSVSELEQAVLALLHAREALAIQAFDVSQESMRLSNASNYDPQKLAPLKGSAAKKRREARISELKALGAGKWVTPGEAITKSSTTESLLSAETKWLVSGIFEDADVIDVNGNIDSTEFESWYGSKCDSANAFQSLFFLFDLDESKVPKPEISGGH